VTRPDAPRTRSEPEASEVSGVVDASPFDLRPEAEDAALCLHGLTGTPYEVRPLGLAIAAAGIRAVGPALPGHNATPQELARVRQEDWVEAARASLRALRADHRGVFGVGLSMGGLVTLLLAAEEGMDAAVVVGTPLRLRGPVRWLVPVLRHWVPFPKKRGGADIADPEARRRHPSYDVMPLAAVHELMRLQARVRACLPRVTAPLFVAHGAHDHTADPDDARAILGAVGSSLREHRVLPHSAHVAPVDRDGPELARAAAEFLVRRGRPVPSEGAESRPDPAARRAPEPGS